MKGDCLYRIICKDKYLTKNINHGTYLSVTPRPSQCAVIEYELNSCYCLQLQQLQQLTSAAGDGGGVTVTLQHGQGGGQLVLTPQTGPAFYPDLISGHTTHSILHHHVRQASIIQQVKPATLAPAPPTPHRMLSPQVVQIFHQQATRNTGIVATQSILQSQHYKY